MDDLLTKADAARLLGLTPAAVVLLEKRGELHAVRTVGGVRLFFRKAVEDLARRRSSGAAAAASGDHHAALKP